jgi:H+-translocating NAD(P) transhydrogenase subunit alpha
MGTELLLAVADVAPLAAELVEQTPAASSGLPLILGLTVFVLAVFLGLEIITKIPPTLHTPLMSGSNAISGITLVGALLMAGAGHESLPYLAWALGFFAVILATINVVGGFLVTNRMLEMFRGKK